MTPLQIKHQIDGAFEQAKRLGFELDLHNQIGIVATCSPYVKGVTVATLPSFEAVICFFNGYEQHQFEQKELNRAKDAS